MRLDLRCWVALLTAMAMAGWVGCSGERASNHAHDPNIITLTTGNFKQQALDSPQPVLVDFWAEWCGPCKVLAPTVSEVAAQYLGKVKVGKVNVDLERSLVEQYKLEGFPTLLIFKNGKEVDRILGVIEKKELQAKLERVLAQ